jgi:hypothetical protein
VIFLEVIMSGDMRGNGFDDRIFDEIIEFLRQLEWPSEALSKKVVRTYYKGEFGLSEVIIYIGTQDICMVIDPAVDRLGTEWGDAVVRLVGAMGEEIRHIGIGIDDEGDLFVKVHLPIAHLNLERFHCLLLGLCQVAENMLLPVLQANAFDHLKAL